MQQGSQDLLGLQAVAQRVTRTLATVGAGLSAGMALRGLMQTGSSFEKVMSEVAARTGAVGNDFARLNELAEQLGRSTIFDGDAAGRAMVELSKAGFNVEQIMASVGDVLSLAAADNLDLAEAAAITAGALKKFELDAGQAGRVTDVLAKGAGSALTDVSTLGEQLAYAAGPAREAGYAIESTVAALGVLSDKVDKSQAGTGLRQVIVGLAKPAAEAQAALDSLGIKTSDAMGNFRPLADIVDDFNDAIGGMASGDKLRTLSTIFETRTANAFAGLMSAGGDELRRLTAELENAGGEAARLAAQMTDNVSGAFTSLMSAVKGFATDTFQLLAGPLKDGLNGLASFITGPVKAAFDSLTSTVDFRPIVGAIAGVVSAGVGLVSVSLAFKAIAIAAIPLIAIGRQIAKTYVAASHGIAFAFAGVRQVGSGLQLAMIGAVDAARATLPVFASVRSAILSSASAAVAFSRSVVASVSSAGLQQLPGVISAAFGSATSRIRLQSALIADVWYATSAKIGTVSTATTGIIGGVYAKASAAVASAAAISSAAWAAASIRVSGAMALLSANAQIVAGSIVKPFATAAGAVVAAWEVAAAKTSATFSRIAATSAYQSVARAASVVRREVGIGVAAVSPIVAAAFGKAFGGVSQSASVMARSVTGSFAAIKVAAIASAAPIGKAFGVVFSGIRVAAGGLHTVFRGLMVSLANLAAGTFGLGAAVAAPLALIAGGFAGVMLASTKGVQALKAGWSSLNEHFATIAIQIQSTFGAMFDAIVRVGVAVLDALGIKFQTSGNSILDSFNSAMEGLGGWIEGALIDLQFFFDNFESYWDLGMAHLDKWIATASANFTALFTRELPIAAAKGISKLADSLGADSALAKFLGIDTESIKRSADLVVKSFSMFGGGLRPRTDAERDAQSRIDSISSGLSTDYSAFSAGRQAELENRRITAAVERAGKSAWEQMMAGSPTGDLPTSSDNNITPPSTGVAAINDRQGPGIAMRGTQAAFAVINRAIRGSHADQKHKEQIGVLNQIATNTATQPEMPVVASI